MASRVYQSGAIIVFEGSPFAALTQTVAEDTDNYADAIASSLLGSQSQAIAEDSDNYADALSSLLLSPLSQAIAEDLDNWADAFGSFVPTLHFTEDVNNFSDAVDIIGLDYVLALVDFIPAPIDSFAAFWPTQLEFADDLDNWLDAIASSQDGFSTTGPADDISTDQGDDVAFTFGLELDINESYFIRDSHDSGSLGNVYILGSDLSIAEDTNNLSDEMTVPGLDQSVLAITEDINNFNDNISVEFPRTNSTQRASQTRYIRRYLNDVEVD